MANKFARVKVSGFMSKSFPVSSINFFQCLWGGGGGGGMKNFHLTDGEKQTDRQTDHTTIFNYLSLRASFLRSAKRGMESLNSLMRSSRTWHMGNALTSFGNLRKDRMKPSMPSVNCSMFKFAHSVSDQSSRATYSIFPVSRGPIHPSIDWAMGFNVW